MSERTAALAKLAALAGKAGAGADASAPAVRPSGATIFGGGDVPRLVLSPVHIAYRDDVLGDLVRPDVKVGDIVSLDEGQAARLEGLGVVCAPDDVTVDAPAPVVDAPPAPGGVVDDATILAFSVADAVAYVNQHPDERPRVRALEEGKGEKARTTLLSALADPDADPDEVLD